MQQARDLITQKSGSILLFSIQGWKLTLARGELNSVRASGSSDLTSPVGECIFVFVVFSLGLQCTIII